MCRLQCEFSNLPSCASLRGTITNVTITIGCRHTWELRTPSCKIGRSTLKAITPPPISKFFPTPSLSPEVNYIKPLPICCNTMQTQRNFDSNSLRNKPHHFSYPTSKNRNHACKIAMQQKHHIHGY